MSELLVGSDEEQYDGGRYTPEAILETMRYQARLRGIRRARKSKFHRRATSAAVTFGVLAAPPLAFAEMIHQDIQQGKAELAYDQAEIHTIYQYDGEDELYGDHGTFVLTGFGTKDPSDTASTLDAHKEVGSIFAIEYSNNSLDIRDLAEKVITTARAQDVHHLSFDGYSLGGLIGVHIAAYIHQHTDDLFVTNVIMNSSPMERDDLIQRSQTALGPIEWITDIYPDLLYSKKLREPVELINRNDRYIEESPDKKHNYRVSGLDSVVLNGIKYKLNFDQFLKEKENVSRLMQDNRKASALLMGMQIGILERNIEDAFIILSTPKKDDDTHVLTNIVYTGSKDRAADPVVDPHSSSTRLAKMMEEFSNPFYILLGDVQHANPAEARASYAKFQRGTLRQATRQNLEAYETYLLAQAPKSDDTSGDLKTDRAIGSN